MSAMHTITVDLADRSYPIVIGSGLLGGGYDIARHVSGPDCLVVSNETVAPLYLEGLLECLGDKEVSVVELPDGERYKTLATVEDILDPTDETGKWAAVKIKPKRKFDHPVTLKAIKQTPELANCELVRLSRLSVAKITPDEWDVICKMAEG